jgi:hypothetical protein
LTVGNALEESYFALEGYTITSVRIEGVIMGFLLLQELLKCYRNYPNLKQVRFKRQIEDMMNQLLFLFQVKIN